MWFDLPKSVYVKVKSAKENTVYVIYNCNKQAVATGISHYHAFTS